MGILTKYAIRKDAKRYVKVLDKLYNGRFFMSKEVIDGTYSLEDNSLLDIFKQTSGLTINQIEEKNIFWYYTMRRKATKSNLDAIAYYIESPDEKVTKYYQKKMIPEYEKYPESERVDRWLQDIWEKPEKRSEFDYNFKNLILEFYKRNFNYPGEYHVYELKPQKGFLEDMYKIFVCEELRVVHAFHAHQLKTQKGMYTTIEADFENSPYFDPVMLTDNQKNLEWYQTNLKKFAQKVGSEEMNQEALYAFLNKKKKNAWKLASEFAYTGYKYGRINIWNELEKNTDKELMDILKTYTLRINPYYYTPFTWGATDDSCLLKYSTDYEDKRDVLGCTLKQLEERKKLKSLSEYFGVTAKDEWILDTKFADDFLKKYGK